MKISPLTIHIQEEALTDLRERLRRTRWPDEVHGAGWAYGANLGYMQELVEYWLDRFDWRAQEEWMNSFPHFQAEVDGTGIHFIHVRGQGPRPLPLILTHGWPSTFYEMLKIIPLLIDPAAHGGDPADAFDVIIPSLPGFGFSDRPLEPGMTRSKVARLWVVLMEGLGYNRFCTHGNDIGAVISAYIGRDFPERLIGLHTMMPTIPGPAFGPDEPPMSPAEREFAEVGKQWEQEEGAYNHLQASRPQTLGFSLNDSPVGLAAWIIEKWRAWGALGSDLEKVFSKDELLTNIAIYWLTETGNSAGRSYYERAHDPNAFKKGEQIRVPTGVALSMEKVQRVPREWAGRVYTDIRHWTEFDHGGHFMALEDPQAVAEDIREFFRGLR
jgi:pimeloyl-ACP methyl ester carboxylesterase